jgi:hypothetical protein
MHQKNITTSFLATLVFMSMSATAQAETQFEQLRERLLRGKPTFSIVNINQCTPKGKKAMVSVTGGVRIDAFQIQAAPDIKISYAHKHFTVMEDGTPVIEFLQYRIFPNDTATFKISRISPGTYKPLSAPLIFECRLGTSLYFVPKAMVASE